MKSSLFKAPPSLVTIQAFVMSAQTKSINKAAHLLHRTQGAVSRQLQQFEAHYNVHLFNRTPQGLELTRDGQRFLDVSHELLAVLGKYDPPASVTANAISLNAPSTFVLRWLAPRLPHLMARPDGCRVDIVSTHLDATTLEPEGNTLIITRGPGLYRNREVIELFAESLTPMCSKNVLDSLDGDLQRLQEHILLHASADAGEWNTWLVAHNLELEQRWPAAHFDTLDLTLSAAELSMGIAMGDPRMASERLQSKQLFMPFTAVVPSGKSYYLNIPEHLSSDPRIRRFCETLVRSVEPVSPR